MKIWIIAAVIIGLLVVGIMTLASPSQQEQSIMTNSNSAQSGEFKWYTDMDSAMVEAKKTNKPIFAYFFATWCSVCQFIESDTLSNEQVKQKLAKDYISIKIDIDGNPQLSEQYKVYGVPTIILMDANGTETSRYPGYQSAEQLLNVL